MTPSTNNLYVRIYINKKDKIILYTGITSDMKRRQKEHDKGLCRTTLRYNKSYNLKEIRHLEYENVSIEMLKALERRFKKLKLIDKVHEVRKWKRWTG